MSGKRDAGVIYRPSILFQEERRARKRIGLELHKELCMMQVAMRRVVCSTSPLEHSVAP